MTKGSDCTPTRNTVQQNHVFSPCVEVSHDKLRDLADEIEGASRATRCDEIVQEAQHPRPKRQTQAIPCSKLKWPQW